MKQFFAPDGPFMRFFSTLFDIVLLNLITIALCIPVITAGAAFTALNYSILKIVRKEEGYLVKDYFKSFKSNFKQATLLWIPMLIIFIAAMMEMYLLRFHPDSLSKSSAIIFGVIFILIYFICTWIYPLLSHFYYDSIFEVLKNSVLLMLSQFPRTLAIAILFAMPIILFFYKPGFMLAFDLILGLSFPAFLSAHLYDSVFKTMEPEEEASGDEVEEELKVIDKLDAALKEQKKENGSEATELKNKTEDNEN